MNGIPDACDIDLGPSDDCQPVNDPGHRIPDECEIHVDQDGGLCVGEPAGCASCDGNNNSVPDQCDIVGTDCAGTSTSGACEKLFVPPGSSLPASFPSFSMKGAFKIAPLDGPAEAVTGLAGSATIIEPGQPHRYDADMEKCPAADRGRSVTWYRLYLREELDAFLRQVMEKPDERRVRAGSC